MKITVTTSIEHPSERLSLKFGESTLNLEISEIMSGRNTLHIDDSDEREPFYVTPEDSQYVAYSEEGEEMWPMKDSHVEGYKDDPRADVEQVELSETPIPPK